MAENKVTLNQEGNLLVQSAYTIQLLEKLNEAEFLKSKFYKDMKFDQAIKDEIKSMGIGNQGCLLLSLYAYLVIPKELLFDGYQDEFHRINAKFGTLATEFNSTYPHETKENADYVRHLRNAVSHARVEFGTNEQNAFANERIKNTFVTFTDRDNKDHTFRAKIPLNQIDCFLNELKRLFIEYLSNCPRT